VKGVERGGEGVVVVFAMIDVDGGIAGPALSTALTRRGALLGGWRGMGEGSAVEGMLGVEGEGSAVGRCG